MTQTSTELRYADVVHHANVKSSISYVSRKTGLGFQETARLLELALARGDLADGNYSGRRLDLYIEEREQALTKEVEQLRARVQELETTTLKMPEPWAYAVAGRIFIGRLPMHIKRAVAAEDMKVQKLYTERQLLTAQRDKWHQPQNEQPQPR